MRTIKIAGAVLLALAILLTFSLTAAADAPQGLAYLDNQTHTLAAGASAMYQFDYAVNNVTNEHPLTTITLVNGTSSGVGFQVWTPDTINDMTDNHPVGAGTAQAIDCTTGNIIGSGGCSSPDLTWTGAFGASGPYYVLITNNNPTQVSYQLNIQGTGVSLGQAVAAAPSAPSAPAAAPAVTATNTDDPARAIAIDGQPHSIPAGSAMWFSFPYGLNDDGTKPVQTITLVNGNQPGLGFQVWAPDSSMINGWYNNNPTGQGTPASVDCNTGDIAGGGICFSNDLTWRGAFESNGTYYVRVWNSGTAPVNATLTIQ